MKRARVLIVLAVLGIGAYIVTSTSELSKVSCEVCMEFEGRSVCRTASGVSHEEAIETARNNGCAQIAFGRADSIRCGNSQPESVQCSE